MLVSSSSFCFGSWGYTSGGPIRGFFSGLFSYKWLFNIFTPFYSRTSFTWYYSLVQDILLWIIGLEYPLKIFPFGSLVNKITDNKTPLVNHSAKCKFNDSWWSPWGTMLAIFGGLHEFPCENREFPGFFDVYFAKSPRFWRFLVRFWSFFFHILTFRLWHSVKGL